MRRLLLAAAFLAGSSAAAPAAVKTVVPGAPLSAAPSAPAVPAAPAAGPASPLPVLAPASALPEISAVPAQAAPLRLPEGLEPAVPGELLSAPAEASREWAEAQFSKVLGETARARRTDHLPGLLTDAWQDRGAVVRALGTDPEKLAGILLSEQSKSDTRVLRVEAKVPGLDQAVVKTLPLDGAKKELFVRQVLAAFGPFRRHFESPAAAGFAAGILRRRGVLVMEWRHTDYEVTFAPQRLAAMAALAYGLGISDMNGGGILKGAGGRTLLLDFQHALTRLRDDMVPGSLSTPMYHFSNAYLSRPEDYEPAVEGWRRAVASPEGAAFLLEAARNAGFSRREARQALETVELNAERLPQRLKVDLEHENADRLKVWSRYGLDRGQMEQLDRINRFAAQDPRGREAIERIRALLKTQGQSAMRWKLWPEKGLLTPDELKDYLATLKR